MALSRLPKRWVERETLQFHEETFVFDGLALSYVLDTPYTDRVRAGGVNACQVTFAGEEDWGIRPLWDATLRAVEAGLRKTETNPATILVTSAEDIAAAHAAGKLSIVMGLQSASMMGMDFWRLRLLHRLGLRCIQLTYNGANLYGDGAGETRDAGVSMAGEELIGAVNELSMWLDLSHCGHRTTVEAAAKARAPVCTHANAFALQPNPRCKTDEAARAVAGRQGVMGVQCAPRLVKGVDATVADVANHIEHFGRVVGWESVGLGLGFTEGLRERGIMLPQSVRWRGLRPEVFGNVGEFVNLPYPQGLESIEELPNLTQELLNRGHPKDRVAAVLGDNWLRAFREHIG